MEIVGGALMGIRSKVKKYAGEGRAYLKKQEQERKKYREERAKWEEEFRKKKRKQEVKKRIMHPKSFGERMREQKRSGRDRRNRYKAFLR